MTLIHSNNLLPYRSIGIILYFKEIKAPISNVGMKRHEALQDYSRDHHFFLLKAREIRWSLEGSEHGRPARHVVRSFLQFWEHDGLVHLREEEEILLPHYRTHASSSATRRHITRIRDEHTWLRAKVETLRRNIEREASFEDVLEEIGRRVHDHVRFEERTVFQHMQQVLTDEQLSNLASASREFRLAHRSPAAIGPRDEH